MKALSPAKVKEVRIDEDTGTAEVIVPDYQLSLAIGKEGQNARLAARLTGWRVDIKSETQLAEEEAYAGEEWAEGEWVVDPETGEQVWQPAEGGPRCPPTQWAQAAGDGRARPPAAEAAADADAAEEPTAPRPHDRRRRGPPTDGRRRPPVASRGRTGGRRPGGRRTATPCAVADLRRPRRLAATAAEAAAGAGRSRPVGPSVLRPHGVARAMPGARPASAAADDRHVRTVRGDPTCEDETAPCSSARRDFEKGLRNALGQETSACTSSPESSG